ncbi:MAG: RidA family protein [Cyclobacteriaceae bacterium]|nr:RidA family protein [Cyclobacteriaceae bacterium]
MERIKVKTGAPWEDKVGYCRAVRVGNTIEVSGTVSLLDGEIYGPGDPYLQTKRILEIISEAIKNAGGDISDVVRTRMYITDQSHWQEVGKAHGEVFSDIKPATSMIVIKALISPEYLVEIEATAIVCT